MKWTRPSQAHLAPPPAVMTWHDTMMSNSTTLGNAGNCFTGLRQSHVKADRGHEQTVAWCVPERVLDLARQVVVEGEHKCGLVIAKCTGFTEFSIDSVRSICRRVRVTARGRRGRIHCAIG